MEDNTKYSHLYYCMYLRYTTYKHTYIHIHHPIQHEQNICKAWNILTPTLLLHNIYHVKSHVTSCVLITHNATLCIWPDQHIFGPPKADTETPWPITYDLASTPRLSDAHRGIGRVGSWEQGRKEEGKRESKGNESRSGGRKAGS